MAGLGRKVFTAGEVLQAADVNNYLMDQAVQVYAGTAARGSALGTSVSEGQVVYLSDTNSLEVYDGSQWGQVSQVQSPNYIINGAFEINQRGFTSATASGMTFDRWNVGIAGDGTATISSQSLNPAGLNVSGFGDAASHIRLVTTGQTSAAVRTSLNQTVEDVRTLAGQTATLSFWAKANSGTPKIFTEIVQLFGTGGSPTVITSGGQVTISTSWTRYSVTIAIPSVSGKTIGAGSYVSPGFWVSAGTDFNSRTGSLGIQSNTFDIWGVQLEAGSVATPFRRNANSLQGELAACQRYYYRIYPAVNDPFSFGSAHQTLAARTVIYFPVEMRVKPTALEQSGTAADYQVGQAGIGGVTCNAVPTFSVATTRLCTIQATVATNLTQFIAVTLNSLNASAYLGWSAEL